MINNPYVAANGVPFNVRIVKQGDKYGLRDQLTHDKPRTMLEFYDATHPEYDETGNNRGQFVSRYYWSTINKENIKYDLDLNGGVESWTVDRKTLKTILRDVAQSI